jgi:predicted MFS family arabinose efflux permease
MSIDTSPRPRPSAAAATITSPAAATTTGPAAAPITDSAAGAGTSPASTTITSTATAARPASKPESLLRHRNFRLLWVGETVSKTGSAITTVAVPLVAISTLQAGTFMVGVLEAAAWLPWLLIGLPAGAWVDRTARRPVMVTCNLVSAGLFASVPIAAWTGWLSLPQLLAVAFCAGLAKVFFRTAYQAYLPAVVDRGQLPAANAALQGSASAADVAGPGLAGVMAQVFGAVTAVFADAVSFLFSALCLLRIDAREPQVAQARRAKGLVHQVGEGLRYVARDPFLRTLTLFGALGNLTLCAFQTLLLLFLIRVVRVESGVAGLLMAGLGVGGVLGALGTKRLVRRLGTARALLWCEAVAAPFGLLLPLAGKSAGGLALFGLGAVVLAAGVVMGGVIASSFRQSYCPPEMLGRVSAVSSFLVFGSMPLGALIAGAAGSVFGVRAALWALAGSLLLPVLVLVFSPISGRRQLPGMEQ